MDNFEEMDQRVQFLKRALGFEKVSLEQLEEFGIDTGEVSKLDMLFMADRVQIRPEDIENWEIQATWIQVPG